MVWTLVEVDDVAMELSMSQHPAQSSLQRRERKRSRCDSPEDSAIIVKRPPRLKLTTSPNIHSRGQSLILPLGNRSASSAAAESSRSRTREVFDCVELPQLDTLSWRSSSSSRGIASAASHSPSASESCSESVAQAERRQQSPSDKSDEGFSRGRAPDGRRSNTAPGRGSRVGLRPRTAKAPAARDRSSLSRGVSYRGTDDSLTADSDVNPGDVADSESGEHKVDKKEEDQNPRKGQEGSVSRHINLT